MTAIADEMIAKLTTNPAHQVAPEALRGIIAPTSTATSGSSARTPSGGMWVFLRDGDRWTIKCYSNTRVLGHFLIPEGAPGGR